MVPKTPFWFLLLALCVVLPTRAQAQSKSAVAEGLFNEAQTLLEQQRFDEACDKLRESDKIEPAVGTKLNLAVCEEKRGRVGTAWALFRATLDLMPLNDPRRSFAETREREIAPRVPHAVLRLAAGAPANTTARIEEIELSSSSFGTPLPVDPGTHTVVVTAPNHEARNFQLQVSEGQQAELTVEPGKAIEATAVEDEPAEPVTNEPQSKDDGGGFSLSRQGAGFLIGAVGVGGMALGAVSGALTLSKRNEGNEKCPSPDNCTAAGAEALDQARTFRTLTNVGFAVGIIGLGVGAYLILTSDDEGAETAVGTAWSNGPELSVRRTF